jgi:hypothetical protein
MKRTYAFFFIQSSSGSPGNFRAVVEFISIWRASIGSPNLLLIFETLVVVARLDLVRVRIDTVLSYLDSNFLWWRVTRGLPTFFHLIHVGFRFFV